MADRISKAFAVSGDKTAIPTDSTTTEVSYDRGFTSSYELEVGVDADARDIDRGQYNQLMNTATGNIKLWQEQGLSDYFSDIGYGAGAQVRYTDGDNYVCHTSKSAGTLPTDHSAFINLKFFSSYGFAVSQLADGDESLVGFIYVGQTVDSFDYLIYPGDGRIYARGSVTGTITAAFNPVDGTASGLSDALIAVTSESQKTKYFSSSEQIMSSGGLVTVAHGLTDENGDPTPPRGCDFHLVCSVAASGYSVGDTLKVSLNGTSSGVSRVSALYFDDTNLYFRFSSESSLFLISHKSTGVSSGAIASNYNLVLTAWY